MEFDVIAFWRWLERILSTEFFAALAAGLTFLVAWRQHVWNKRNHLASVRPYICDFLERDFTELNFTFRLENKGLGPAKFESFSLAWDGQPISHEGLESRLSNELGDTFKISVSELSGQSALGVNDKVKILSFVYTGCSKDQRKAAQVKYDEVVRLLIAKCRLIVKYRSFLNDEKFVYETKPLESLLDKV